LELRAIVAALGGRSEVAKAWTAAARECSNAVRGSHFKDDDMDELLCNGWQYALQRAEALAEVAHRVEEAVAKAAEVAV
jgi:hypothetical protein